MAENSYTWVSYIFLYLSHKYKFECQIYNGQIPAVDGTAVCAFLTNHWDSA